MLYGMEQQVCSVCHIPLLESYYFCPNCGKQVKEPPFSISIGKQIGLYLLAFFLPPFGFYPGIKYLLKNDQKAKIVGSIIILLTTVSLVINIWIAIEFTNRLYGQLNTQFNTQMNQYQEIGL